MNETKKERKKEADINKKKKERKKGIKKEKERHRSSCMWRRPVCTFALCEVSVEAQWTDELKQEDGDCSDDE